MLRHCRDCANLEERRDIDDVAICKKNHGPFICCDDFDPKAIGLNVDRQYNRYCIECANFEAIDDSAICAKNHTQGIACDEFTDNFRELKEVIQNNLMKNVLLVHSIFYSNVLPEYLIKIGQKIKW